jgi:hypothetical protein
MLISDSTEVQDRATDSLLDPNARNLLDHIAVELAAEYIRLMEAAAETEALSPVNTVAD